jgi:hypothetical protein
MAMANTLAYYDTVTITAVKNFIVQAPDTNVIKLFMAFFSGKTSQPSLMFEGKARVLPE